ncbi:MAG: NADH-quinone oxidoreductase subunit C [Bilophila wadsworthia]
MPTITPWFRNADWNEREFAELFDVHVDGNTNPKRLFLDPEIDEGILNEVIPLTIMMNGGLHQGYVGAHHGSERRARRGSGKGVHE